MFVYVTFIIHLSREQEELRNEPNEQKIVDSFRVLRLLKLIVFKFTFSFTLEQLRKYSMLVQ